MSLFISASLKGKRLELSTSLIDIRCLVVGRQSAHIHLEVKRSKVKVTGLSNMLLAWICMSTGLLRFSKIVLVFVS